MEKNIQSVPHNNDYAFQLRTLARRLFFSLIIFFLLSVTLALIFITGSTGYYDIEILLTSAPFLIISLIFVLYFFFQLLHKFRFLGINEPSAKFSSKYSILMVIGFIICINSSFFSFVEVNSEWYYFQHCLAILGIVLLLIGAINFSRTLSIFRDKKKIQSFSTTHLRFIFPFIFIAIIEVINAIARKAIFLNLDYDGYRWRTAQAEACKALNYTTFFIIISSVILFLYALFAMSKDLGTLDSSVSNHYTSQLLETPSERVERICKQLSVFLIITTITVSLIVLFVLSEIYWGFWYFDDYGTIVLIIEFSLLTIFGMALVYGNTFRFLLQIKEFSNYFPELKKITKRTIYLIGGGILVITLGCNLTFWSITSLIDLPQIVSRIIILVGLLLVTSGMFYLRRFFLFFINKGYLSNGQLKGSNILFYTSLFIPFVLLAEIITTNIVNAKFSEIRCTAWDYCRVVLTPQGEIIMQWLFFSILFLFTLLVIVFSAGLSLTSKNFPQIHSILDEKSISEINTISLRNKIIIGLLKGKDRVAYNKAASYDYVLKQRKILNSSRNFIILFCTGIFLNLLAQIIFVILVSDHPMYFYSIIVNGLSFGRSFVIVVSYVFLFIFLEELRQVTRNTEAKTLSLRTVLIFSIGMILSTIFRELSFLYSMIFDMNTALLILNIVINSIFVLGCVFLMLTLNKAISKEKNLMAKLPYYGLILSSSLILLRSIIYAILNPIKSTQTIIVIFSIDLVLSAIVGVLMIICTIRIRSELPDLDSFQLKEVKEGEIDQKRSETVHPSVVYNPITSKQQVAFCVNCGERVKSDTNFCNSCGANIEML